MRRTTKGLPASRRCLSPSHVRLPRSRSHPARSSLQRVVKTTVYVTDLSVFARVNAVYARHFTSQPFPARATVEVAALPLGAEIEIDAIARLG